MDFTLATYRNLLIAFQRAHYGFATFQQFCEGSAAEKCVILRHDVDLKAKSSLETAEIEYHLGIPASYYFRVVPQSNKPHIIKQIADLKHEIGYHYEDLALFKGDKAKAIAHFEKQLTCLRRYYPVKTICMHGSFLSKYDNRDLWQSYNYRDFGIIGEPYLDIDFNKVLYLTDTGRCWDGERFRWRDKVSSSFTLRFHTSRQICEALEKNTLPDKIMITTHPQRWTDNPFSWMVELLSQTAKNSIKLVVIKQRNRKRQSLLL
ncbi:MAG: hypothetical protein LBS16_03460 [Prevotellaceae bacterium]|jgi:hypothetical protein|nr:hypothetical protein [Prevotellaceae bacterium]